MSSDLHLGVPTHKAVKHRRRPKRYSGQATVPLAPIPSVHPALKPEAEMPGPASCILCLCYIAIETAIDTVQHAVILPTKSRWLYQSVNRSYARFNADAALRGSFKDCFRGCPDHQLHNKRKPIMCDWIVWRILGLVSVTLLVQV
nr:hypothetical protein CFP56_09985 [Quercus suber]